MSVTRTKNPNKFHICIVRIIVILVFIVSNATTGVICWHLAEETAEKDKDAKLQAYKEEYNVSKSQTYQRLSESWTRTLTDVYGDVIFFGDSITAGGLWAEYYPYLTPVNLGVVGDTIDGLMTRLPQLEMVMGEKCFILIGVNDLIYENPVDVILKKYECLLKALSEIRDEIGTEMYVQSVLPVRENVTVYLVKNEDICTLNKGIIALTDQYEMTYIDVHAQMVDNKGELNEAYSFDGLHLTNLGYQAWQELLIPYLDE